MRQEKFTVSLPSHWITSICVFSHLYFTHCFRSVLRLATPFTSPTLEVCVRIVFRRFCAHRNRRYLRNDGTPFTRTLTILIKIYKNPFTFQLWMRSLIINMMNFTKTNSNTRAPRTVHNKLEIISLIFLVAIKKSIWIAIKSYCSINECFDDCRRKKNHQKTQL